MDHCQHLVFFTSWFLWTFLLDIKIILNHKQKKMSNTTSQLNFPLVFSRVIWRRGGNSNDYFIDPSEKDLLDIRMVVTEFGMNCALELFLNLAPKFMILRWWLWSLVWLWYEAGQQGHNFSPETVTGDRHVFVCTLSWRSLLLCMIISRCEKQKSQANLYLYW